MTERRIFRDVNGQLFAVVDGGLYRSVDDLATHWDRVAGPDEWTEATDSNGFNHIVWTEAARPYPSFRPNRAQRRKKAKS